jgi:thiamine biosynthesis lipoprotein
MKTSARLLVLLGLFWPGLVFSALQEVREVHYQMGTVLELTLWHSEPEVAKRLIRLATQEVHRLEEVLSNFDADSAVARLNQQAGKGKTNIPTELYELLQIAQRFSAETSGDFDITVGPLLELWREASLRDRLPDRGTLARALGLVGYEKLKLYGGQDAELMRPGMIIDLGGIGKGYAVDVIASRFKAAGVSSALINFGGSSIFALGTPPAKQSWEIGIRDTNSRLRGLIHLRDMALSTSGSMGKFWTIAGKKYGHVIDPKNGMPVSESRMATAIASNATLAEALTKPLVLRGKQALRIVTRLSGSEAVIISEKGPLVFSQGFKSETHWQGIPNS